MFTRLFCLSGLRMEGTFPSLQMQGYVYGSHQWQVESHMSLDPRLSGVEVPFPCACSLSSRLGVQECRTVEQLDPLPPLR